MQRYHKLEVEKRAVYKQKRLLQYTVVTLKATIKDANEEKAKNCNFSPAKRNFNMIYQSPKYL